MTDPWHTSFTPDLFSDEELAGLGLTRAELTPENMENVIAQIKNQALNEWIDIETGIEDLVVQAQEAIALFPGDRKNAMARYYGERMVDVSDLDPDPERLLQLFVFTTFKLAEARNDIARLIDGNRRIEEEK